MKESYFFDRLARMVAGHPKFVLTLLVAISAVLASQLRYIEADPSPQALLASADPEQQKLEDEARQLFGSTDNVVVLVISGRNAVDKSTLDYAHTLSTAMTKLPHVVRVDSLTRQTWPKPKRDEATLDDLSATEDEAP